MKNKLLLVILGTILFFNVDFGSSQPTQSIFLGNISIINNSVINQSINIPTGNYMHSIFVTADNLKITCQPGAIFDGANNLVNGLIIISKRNITVEGCSFKNFKENGIYIIGNLTDESVDIKLLNVDSSFNKKSGIYLGPKSINTTIKHSNINNNRFDGIYIKDLPWIVTNNSLSNFPNGIYISKNNIIENGRNGINFDASEQKTYFKYFLPYFVENEIIISENNILNNRWDGIRNTAFFEGHKDYLYQSKSKIIDNFIKNNYKSGISIYSGISQKVIPPSWVSNFPSTTLTIAGFGTVAFNDLSNNGEDGISFYSEISSNSRGRIYSNEKEAIIRNVFGNYISDNQRHGIYVTSNAEKNDFRVSSNITQNFISNNGKDGINLKGNKDGKLNRVFLYIYCNDLYNNGKAEHSGINSEYVTGYNWIYGNLIEKNKHGVFIGENSTQMNIVYKNIIIQNALSGVSNNYTSGEVILNYNDFKDNNVQAFDSNSFNRHEGNWFSEYSPTCIDIDNDLICDLQYNISLNNFDPLPKAGTPYINWQFSQLVKNNSVPGIMLRNDCPKI